MHVSTIPSNFNKLLSSKTTKASINEKIFMINKSQWGEFQCSAFSHSNFDISLTLFHWPRGNFCNLNSTWQCFLAFVKTKGQNCWSSWEYANGKGFFITNGIFLHLQIHRPNFSAIVYIAVRIYVMFD